MKDIQSTRQAARVSDGGPARVCVAGKSQAGGVVRTNGGVKMLTEYDVAIYAVMQDGGGRTGTVAGEGRWIVDPVGRTPCYFGAEELRRFESALAEVGGGFAGVAGSEESPVLSGGEELGLRVIIEAEGALEALGDVERSMRRAARLAYGGGVRIVEGRVAIVPSAEASLGHAVGNERPPDRGIAGEGVFWRRRAREELVGIREGAQVIGRSEQRIRTLDKERSEGVRTDFPAPVLRLEAGPFWARDDLRAFRREYERSGRRGRGGPGSSLVTLSQLRPVRKQKGYRRQEDLANASGVSVPTISHAERGGRTQRETAQRIAAALDTSVHVLEGRQAAGD